MICHLQSKTSSDCECRLLPAEVTWMNAVLGRVVFDLMRDPIMIKRLQDRIQRKLNTLKVRIIYVLVNSLANLIGVRILSQWFYYIAAGFIYDKKRLPWSYDTFYFYNVSKVVFTLRCHYTVEDNVIF